MRISMTGTFAVGAANFIPRVTAPTGALRQGSGVPSAAKGGLGTATRLRGKNSVTATEPDSAWRTLPV